MKKGLALFIILLLTINLVSAGETFRLDFTTSPAYTVGLNEGDRVEFKLKDSLHTIILKETAQGNADIAIFTNISDNNLDLKVPIYTKINSQKFVRVDVEKDGETDLNIIYQNSNSSSASILFQLPIGPNKNLEVFPENQFKKDNMVKNLLYLFIVLIVVFGLIFFILKTKAKETLEAVENKEKETE